MNGGANNRTLAATGEDPKLKHRNATAVSVKLRGILLSIVTTGTYKRAKIAYLIFMLRIRISRTEHPLAWTASHHTQ